MIRLAALAASIRCCIAAHALDVDVSVVGAACGSTPGLEGLAADDALPGAVGSGGATCVTTL